MSNCLFQRGVRHGGRRVILTNKQTGNENLFNNQTNEKKKIIIIKKKLSISAFTEKQFSHHLSISAIY